MRQLYAALDNNIFNMRHALGRLPQLPGNAFAVVPGKGSGIGHCQSADNLAHPCDTFLNLDTCIGLKTHTGFGVPGTEQCDGNSMLSESLGQQRHDLVKSGLARAVEIRRYRAFGIGTDRA